MDTSERASGKDATEVSRIFASARTILSNRTVSELRAVIWQARIE
jgi:hypothetical protein